MKLKGRVIKLQISDKSAEKKFAKIHIEIEERSCEDIEISFNDNFDEFHIDDQVEIEITSIRETNRKLSNKIVDEMDRIEKGKKNK